MNPTCSEASSSPSSLLPNGSADTFWRGAGAHERSVCGRLPPGELKSDQPLVFGRLVLLFPSRLRRRWAGTGSVLKGLSLTLGRSGIAHAFDGRAIDRPVEGRSGVTKSKGLSETAGRSGIDQDAEFEEMEIDLVCCTWTGGKAVDFSTAAA